MAPLKFILLSSFLFLGLDFPDTVLVKNDVYSIEYSERLEQPVNIEYVVDCSHASGIVYSRFGMNFYTEKGIKTSDDNDYKSNIWDRGHMAPAADFSCDLDKLKKTFSYVNCALQHKDLNRGAWKDLEEYERELAFKSIVSIKIQVEFNQSKTLNTGATIPSGFTKTIFINGKFYQSYYFPNTSPTQSFQKYLVK